MIRLRKTSSLTPGGRGEAFIIYASAQLQLMAIIMADCILAVPSRNRDTYLHRRVRSSPKRASGMVAQNWPSTAHSPSRLTAPSIWQSSPHTVPNPSRGGRPTPASLAKKPGAAPP
jgi:hypothetical protein